MDDTAANTMSFDMAEKFAKALAFGDQRSAVGSRPAKCRCHYTLRGFFIFKYQFLLSAYQGKIKNPFFLSIPLANWYTTGIIYYTMQDTTTIKRRPRLRDEVRDRILKMIRESGMHPGDRLLSEKKLGQSFKVNHLTIRAALSDLEHNGIVERRPGSGTFLTGSLHSSSRGKPVESKLAVIAIREEEHFFSRLRHAIIHELEKDGYMCLASSFSDSGPVLVEQLIDFQGKA